jgi:hypothetical protein
VNAVQPRNPAEPGRHGLADATQMDEEIVAPPVQPLCESAGAERRVAAPSAASLLEGEFCEHDALETWVNAHGLPSLTRPRQTRGVAMAAGHERRRG